jgi:hypothetical protein
MLMSVIRNIMELIVEGKKRETIGEPLYKKVGRDGKVYISRDLADQEILVIPVKAIPEDKINYINLSRRRSSGAI